MARWESGNDAEGRSVFSGLVILMFVFPITGWLSTANRCEQSTLLQHEADNNDVMFSTALIGNPHVLTSDKRYKSL